MLINSVDGGDIMAAFERFRSLCGGSKADYNTKISIGTNNKKRQLKAKLKKRGAIQLKKSNKRAQNFSINNFRQEHETKLVTCIPKANSFDGMLNQAVKVSQNNKIAETKSISTNHKVEKRMNMLNKYGELKGIILDR